jgi:hypothetical protein
VARASQDYNRLGSPSFQLGNSVEELVGSVGHFPCDMSVSEERELFGIENRAAGVGFDPIYVNWRTFGRFEFALWVSA